MIDCTETYIIIIIITHYFWYEKGIDMGDGSPDKFENFPIGGRTHPLNPPPGSASAKDLEVLYWIA